LFDTVRIWEFSPVWTDFDKFDNLSKRNVKLILNILSDLEPLRGSSNKKTLYSTRSCVNWAFWALVPKCGNKHELQTGALFLNSNKSISKKRRRICENFQFQGQYVQNVKDIFLNWIRTINFVRCRYYFENLSEYKLLLTKDDVFQKILVAAGFIYCEYLQHVWYLFRQRQRHL
jgi:hypothetical protein